LEVNFTRKNKIKKIRKSNVGRGEARTGKGRAFPEYFKSN
jgi:hypothetical protein